MNKKRTDGNGTLNENEDVMKNKEKVNRQKAYKEND